jgi:hypothetical protein
MVQMRILHHRLMESLQLLQAQPLLLLQAPPSTSSSSEAVEAVEGVVTASLRVVAAVLAGTRQTHLIRSPQGHTALQSVPVAVVARVQQVATLEKGPTAAIQSSTLSRRPAEVAVPEMEIQQIVSETTVGAEAVLPN